MHNDSSFAQRRRLVALAGGWALVCPLTRSAATEPDDGWLPTRTTAAALRITGTDGRTLALPAAIAGRVTAVQLMFTGCSATCPTQGALFAALAARLRSPDVQLLSISIDVLGDNPARVAAWQGRFGHHPAWHAAVAAMADVDRLAAYLKGASARPGTHTAQVFVFDRKAQLRLRSGDAPELGEVEAMLARASRVA